MRWLEPWWLLGLGVAGLVGVVLLFGAYRFSQATKRFGDEDRVRALMTADASLWRTVRGVLALWVVALAFVALARPQYGGGRRRIPATNLDVVIVLDFSKSMYARDVAPSRIARAKAEVTELTRALAGARFGAVAFAGEPIGFPLTSDGAAIATFLRQTEPNDMPVGGTAIARALEKAREILARDPKAKDHRRVIVLITDGEDLEGDPVEVAKAAGAEGTTVNVVQIGGRSPERIPEIAPDGRTLGFRTDEQGRPLTTELTAEGEAQLAQVAEVGGGKIIRAEKGSTGIAQMTTMLRTLMTEELGERTEKVYEDQYAIPAGVAVLLLIVETFVNEAPKRKPLPPDPPPRHPVRLARRREEARDAA